MNTDNDVNVSRLVTKLGLNRRQFLAATTGMAAAAAVTAPSALAGPVGTANGILIPAPRRLPSSGASSPATTPTASEYAGGGVRGPKWEYEREHEQEGAVGRRALPAPEVPDPRAWWACVGELLGYGRGRRQGQGQRQRGGGRGRRATMSVRAMKSCVLVAKVCPSLAPFTSVRPRRGNFLIFLLAARMLTPA